MKKSLFNGIGSVKNWSMLLLLLLLSTTSLLAQTAENSIASLAPDKKQVATTATTEALPIVNPDRNTWATFTDANTYISYSGKGRIFRVGDKIHLGNSVTGGNFKNISWKGWSYLPGKHQNKDFVITEIKGAATEKKGQGTIKLVIAINKYDKFDVDIESAIRDKEVDIE